MQVQRSGVLVLAALLGAVSAAAGGCGTSSGSGGASASSSATGSETSSSSTSTGSSGMTSSSSSSSSASTTSSSSGSGAGGATPGHCKKGCVQASDCCPPNMPSCPGAMYPNNYTCDKGACVPPQCSAKADCTAGGQLPQYDCIVIKSLHACVKPCAMDADCGAPSKCIGVADDMSKYCKVDTGPACTGPADCAGIGQCVNGDCVCFGKADCTDPTANVCAN